MGVDILSMSATYVPPIAKILRRLTRADLDDYVKIVEAMGDGASAAEILAACENWMRARIPDLANIVL